MKEKYKQRLQDDFIKYSKQIGIRQDEMPRLITDKITMDELKQTFPDKGRGRSTGNNYGICYRKQRVIYVNGNKRIQWNKAYKNFKYTDRYTRKHKTAHRDLLETLVHELIHYRWKYLQHGAKYEERIKKILRGKIYPAEVLFANDNTSQPSDKSVTTVAPEEHRPIYESDKNRLERLKRKIRFVRVL